KLPAGSPNHSSINKRVVRSGFQELSKVWGQLKHMNFLKTFLFAFFFYSMGVQTIMLAAAGFGEKTLKLGTSKLIITILIIQLVAILGAIVMSNLAKRKGNVSVLIFVVIIWILACICGYFIHTEMQFYGLAAVVGLIMGGIQSLSRSTYSKYLPANTPDTTSFFSFYDVTEKVAIVIGLFCFAFIEEASGSMRNSIIALASFFLIGLVFLLILRKVERKLVLAS
ncbi:MAG: MFS transporter, partial [Sphingobacteriales bacterium]